MALTPLGTIQYYEKVLDRDAGAIEDVRLMLLPGIDHCAGGAGPYLVNMLIEIDNWVESGVAPNQLTAYWLNIQNQPDGARPVCGYPKYLRYNASGDTRVATSFSCVSD